MSYSDVVNFGVNGAALGGAKSGGSVEIGLGGYSGGTVDGVTRVCDTRVGAIGLENVLGALRSVRSIGDKAQGVVLPGVAVALLRATPNSICARGCATYRLGGIFGAVVCSYAEASRVVGDMWLHDVSGHLHLVAIGACDVDEGVLGVDVGACHDDDMRVRFVGISSA